MTESALTVYVVAEVWHWDNDWNIDSIYATQESADARATELRDKRDPFSIKNGLGYEVYAHSVLA